MKRKKCQHPPLNTFIAFQGKAAGTRVWRCSHCGKEDVWRESWLQFGSIECPVCCREGVLAVLCSDACREAFKPSDPKLALLIATAVQEAWP
jgi:hypothetical protein